MKLEEFIYNTLIQSNPLKKQLATFDGVPAVFELKAPEDTDRGWGKKKQYPRIDYTVDRLADHERQTEATVVINIWCMSSGTGPEELEPHIRGLLDNIVFNPDDEPLMAMRWQRSDVFDIESKDDLIIGITLVFDIFAFPYQTTISPDPVVSLSEWAKKKFPELQVNPLTWSQSSLTPAIYIRFPELNFDGEQTASVTWASATLYVHIMTHAVNNRLVWIRKIAQELMLDSEVLMDDGSYMILKQLNSDTQQDPLRVGQIKATFRFGILPNREKTEKINKAYL